MCYMTIVSTTSNLDLTEFNTGDVVFDREMPGIPEELLLQYDNKWYLGSSQGCSCGFRHLMSANFKDLGFAEPEDWFPENKEDIEATLKLVNIFKTILSDGSKLECIDAWASDNPQGPNISGQVDVDLSQIPEAAFRFIENYQHEFSS